MAQDSQHRHQQQVPSRKADATPYAGIRYRLDLAVQVEIGGVSGTYGHREAIPPTSTRSQPRQETVGQTVNSPARTREACACEGLETGLTVTHVEQAALKSLTLAVGEQVLRAGNTSVLRVGRQNRGNLLHKKSLLPFPVPVHLAEVVSGSASLSKDGRGAGQPAVEGLGE